MEEERLRRGRRRRRGNRRGGRRATPAPRVDAQHQAASSRARRSRRTCSRASASAAPTSIELPPLTLLAEPKRLGKHAELSDEALEQNARMLEGVLDDFGVKGQIIKVRPGPVVTLYELEPAPGIKSSRVISLADDIARSMSAISARVAVVPGPQRHRHRAAQRQARDGLSCARLLASEDFEKIEPQPGARAGQEHRRRAGLRRPRPHAASADRRHHRLGQVGGHQHHDPVAALPAAAGALQADHDRSQDAGTVRLRRHSASPVAGRHRSAQGGRGAEMGGARDGRALSQDVEARRAQHRRLQRPHEAGRGRRARSCTAPCRPASTPRPASRSSRRRRWTSRRCPTSSSSSTRWPT